MSVVLNLGSRDPLGVPNADLEYPQISPNIFASNSLRVAFVYTLRTLSCSHSSSVFSSFLFSLVYLFGRAAIKVETTVCLPGERFLLALFRSAHFFNFDLGVPDDIGRVQGIPAVKKVKNHCRRYFRICLVLDCCVNADIDKLPVNCLAMGVFLRSTCRWLTRSRLLYHVWYADYEKYANYEKHVWQ